MLSQADRIAFSLSIVSVPANVAAITLSKQQGAKDLEAIQKLDAANANLFAPVNNLVTAYQIEYGDLDGKGRTTITEQDFQDSGNRKVDNYFFPNNINLVVPSLASLNNVWPRVNPFALTVAIGKSKVETYGSVPNETQMLTAILTLINSASAYQNIELTSGQHATEDDPAAMPPVVGGVSTFAAVQTLKTNLVTAINNFVSFLTSEFNAIVTNDPDSANQTNNNAAKTAITNTKAALAAWLANPDFHTVPGSITTFTQFYAYDPSLLAPTKLYSVQLNSLKTAILNRQTFVGTRLSQLSTLMGTISQDIATGEVTSSGLYGKRYGFIVLRLNVYGGSLSQLLAGSGRSAAQDAIISNLKNTAATYSSIIPTSLFGAPANGTNVISVVDGSKFSPGNPVYIYAEQQDELVRAVKSVNGNSITLNDSVPAKYNPTSNARIYKDLS